MLHAVVMAGGSGTRFWPLSRAATPKQLLQLVGSRSMIQTTLDRLGGLVDADRVLIVTNERQAEAIRRQLPDLPEQAVLGEPCKRDTAPCIGLAAGRIAAVDDDATMIVMPADHVIEPPAVFQEAVRQAARLVDERPARLVTFGIRPTYPAESFGYIERAEPLAGHEQDRPAVYDVARFREKPDAQTARAYLDSGHFYWNSGIFVWKARTILDALEQHQSELFAHLQTIAAAWGSDRYDETFRYEFAAIHGISIDYAVMEHAGEVVVIDAPFDWDDVGSWQSLARLRGTDPQGNTIVGKHLGVGTTGTIVRGDADHLIVTLGLTDCIVVHTADATLVANKHDEESIRKVVKLLEEKGWNGYL